jgi:hypothetical protein
LSRCHREALAACSGTQPVRVSAWAGSRPCSVRTRPASPRITAVAKL